MPLISVVVPIHNEDYILARCVDSILGQTHRDLEVMLIDDASSDRSGAMCDEYAARDGRVRVSHQKKGDAATARNAGLAMATGDYVQFVDADDYLDPDMTEAMLALMEREKAGLVTCGWNTVFLDSPGAVARWKGVFSYEGRIASPDYLAMNRFAPHWNPFSSVWNKLYRGDVLRGNKIAFKPGIAPCEDVLFNIEYAKAIDEVFVDNTRRYNYTVETARGRLPLNERAYPRVIDIWELLCRSLLEAVDGRCPEKAVGELKGMLASQMIMAMVKACRRDSTLGEEATVARLRELAETPDVREWFGHYRPGPGQSRLIPFLFVRGWTRALFRFGRHKADKRYRNAYVFPSP